MIDVLGERQQALMKLLLGKKRQGFTIDELGEKLGITRTAVKQHLVVLERAGCVEHGTLQASGGRPRRTYRLTGKGYDFFPKQYSWFSEAILEAVRKEKGPEGLLALMDQLGNAVSSGLKAQLGDGSAAEKVRKTAELMNQLAYEAQVAPPVGKNALPAIEATNCVYHALAARFPEVCQFDLALLANLTGATPVHEKCIVKGSDVCRFRFEKR
ncbi:MAG: HTH domain-containing protein [Deltaproteobacteria bacterium]|nr:HTH domain-containing protein [Deltaproteobacteria bacterium]